MVADCLVELGPDDDAGGFLEELWTAVTGGCLVELGPDDADGCLVELGTDDPGD